jgi:hypothetical protein
MVDEVEVGNMDFVNERPSGLVEAKRMLRTFAAMEKRDA